MATRRGKTKKTKPKARRTGRGGARRGRASRAPRARRPGPARRDTPRETPAELIEPPRLTDGATAAAAEALARVQALESIESAYDAWLELRLGEAQLRARVADERRRLDEQGDLLVGAVRVASELKGTTSAPALVATDSLTGFQAAAQARLATARAALDAQLAQAERSFLEAAAEIREVIRARIEHRARTVRPRMRLMVRTLAQDRRVLHAQRPDPDDSIALLWVFSRRIPSRYGYLFDDSTDDAAAAPPTLYADEGVAAAETRPPPAQLKSLLDARPGVWPVKGILPMWLPPLGGTVVAVRWLERGPVMEAEIEDGAGFRSVLTREEAERIAGYLLALMLEGRLELELVRE